MFKRQIIQLYLPLNLTEMGDSLLKTIGGLILSVFCVVVVVVFFDFFFALAKYLFIGLTILFFASLMFIILICIFERVLKLFGR